MLETVDVNAIKLLNVATSSADTCLQMSAGFVKDMSSSAKPSDAATLHVEDRFTPDATSPSLLSFTFNLTREEIVLNFNEVVNTTTFDPEGITLLSAAETNPASSVRLDAATTPSVNGLRVVVKLTQAEVDRITVEESLFTDNFTSFISVEPRLIKDMAGLAVNQISASDAIPARAFVDDAIRPSLVSFGMDMDSATLSLTFDEVVDVSSIVLSDITLQLGSHSSSDTTRHGLSSGTLASTDGTVAAFILSNHDMNELKRRSIGLDADSLWITMLSTAAKDMNELAVLPLETGVNAIAVDENAFVVDSTKPSLLFSRLDLTAETLTLSFDETVNSQSLTVSELRIQGGQRSDTQFYVLQSNSGTASAHGPQVVIDLGDTDLNELKRLTELATEKTTTYLSYTENFVHDMNENNVSAVAVDSGVEINEYERDGTAPRLLSVSLNMDTLVAEEIDAGQPITVASASITLSFDETVLLSSHRPNKLTIQGVRVLTDPAEQAVPLTGSQTTVSRQDGTTIKFKLLRTDANSIKKLADLPLAISRDNTYLAMDSEFVTDMAGNEIVEIPSSNAEKFDEVAADGSPPTLLGFSIDLDEGDMSMTFDETVRGSSITPIEFLLRDTQDPETPGSFNFTFTGGIGDDGVTEWVSGNNARDNTFPHANSAIITMKFTKVDLDEIKRLSLCTTNDDCFLIHTEYAVSDMRDIDIVACT